MMTLVYFTIYKNSNPFSARYYTDSRNKDNNPSLPINNSSNIDSKRSYPGYDDNGLSSSIYSDRDSISHGCNTSIGFIWCEPKQKCLLTSVEICESLSNEKVYCNSDEKHIRECSDNFSMTCGWFYPNVDCLIPPCKENFPDSCHACDNPSVEYWTEGACPN